MADKLRSRKLWMAVVALVHIDMALWLGALTGAEFIMGVIGILALYGGSNVAASYAFAALMRAGGPPLPPLPGPAGDDVVVEHTEVVP